MPKPCYLGLNIELHHYFVFLIYLAVSFLIVTSIFLNEYSTTTTTQAGKVKISARLRSKSVPG